MPQISCKNVSITYNNNIVIDNISFDISSGEYVCILGKNGTGKSSIVKAILGLTKFSGSINFCDGLKQSEIGYLPQQTESQEDFPASVFEVVLSGRLNQRGFKPFYSKEDKLAVDSALKKLNAINIKDKSFRDLSGGQKQRALLARAVCATVKVLILDEPVSALDNTATGDMYELIKKLNKLGITIIMITHDIENAVKYADKILMLNEDTYSYSNASEFSNL